MRFDPKNDGVDHINIYLKGQTQLGRSLSNLFWSPITLPEDGYFGTIEGYWYWLSTRDERLRTLTGFDCKKLGKQLGRKFTVPDFESKICSAIDYKIWTNVEIRTALKISSLPFAHYYVYSDKLVEAGYEWIANHIDEVRSWLRSNAL